MVDRVRFDEVNRVVASLRQALATGVWLEDAKELSGFKAFANTQVSEELVLARLISRAAERKILDRIQTFSIGADDMAEVFPAAAFGLAREGTLGALRPEYNDYEQRYYAKKAPGSRSSKLTFKEWVAKHHRPAEVTTSSINAALAACANDLPSVLKDLRIGASHPGSVWPMSTPGG